MLEEVEYLKRADSVCRFLGEWFEPCSFFNR